MRKDNINNLTQSIPIYEYLEEYLSRISRVTFRKGEYLFRGDKKEKTVFYILDGIVAIENVTYNGKKLVVEHIEKHTFAGHIADMHHVNLQSSGVAVTAVDALVIPEDVMDTLMDNDRFALHFYQVTSGKVFRMYKAVLAKVLFNPNEILAHYILNHAQDGMFTYKSAYSLCDKIGISRRGFYDILYRFEEMGCIKKIESSVYQIVGEEQLEKQAEHMLEFMKN